MPKYLAACLAALAALLLAAQEWWHFDYKDWRKYPILTVPFERLGAERAR